MHSRWPIVPLMIIVALAAGTAVVADDTSAPADTPKRTVTVVTSAARNEVRDYKVTFELSEDKPGKAAPPATVSFKIRHTYGVREGEDLLPMEVTLQQGQVITQGQALEITPSIYPRLTVLLDTHFRVTDVLGASNSRFTQSTPGINYGNMPVLFYLPDADQPHAIGDTWQAKLKLPSLGQAYDIATTLKSVEVVDGVETARVTQQIASARQPVGGPGSHMKCTVESSFAISNGKLLKSHAECTVDLPPDVAAGQPAGENAKPTRAKARIDIAVVK